MFSLPSTIPAGAVADGNFLWFDPFATEEWHGSAQWALESILRETYRRARAVSLSDLNRGVLTMSAVTNMDGDFYRVALQHRSDEPMFQVLDRQLYMAHRGLRAILIPPDVASDIPIVHLATGRRVYVDTPLGAQRVTTDTRCGACGLSPARDRCSGCHAIHYCSASCQRRHWQRHKRACAWWRESTQWL